MCVVNIFVKYFHNKGGGERIAFNFVNYLLSQNIKVRVVCGIDKLKDERYSDNLIVTGLLKPGRYLKYSSYHKRAQSVMKTLDGVHFSFDRIPGCHIYRNGSGLHSSYVKKTLTLMPKGKAFKKSIERSLDPINRLLISMEKKVYPHTDLQKIILNSEFLKREVLSAFPEIESKIEIIPNGVSKEKYKFSATDRPFRDKYSIPINKFCIGFAANNFQRKGLDFLINALALLPDTYCLLVAGGRRPDSYLSMINDLGLKDRVIFVGEVEDMQGFYSSCDVLALPSLYDSFGNVVPESLICGTPVVVSAMAGSSEIVKDGENGYVVADLHPKGLSRALEQACSLGRQDYSDYVLSEDEMYSMYLDVIRSIEQ
ncbi:MAG: hypothetical protein C0603_12155 [Denitrovibrio sp.]|nr:MAG: hypothetical protein C0603_12155 [Denitrovibrio sp.]